MVAAIVYICMAAHGCQQLGGNISPSWCGKAATLERTAELGGNVTLRVQCPRTRPGRR